MRVDVGRSGANTSSMSSATQAPSAIRLVGAARLGPGEARAFGEGETGGFVLRRPSGPADGGPEESGFVAYRNRCPHWGVDLDVGMGDFYDARRDRIFCRSHGALFVVDTGECDRGPCVGERLEALEVRVDGDDLLVSPVG